MQERKDVITFGGSPLTLQGPALAVGVPAPDFAVLANDLSPRSMADYKGKILVISVVPSLDTGVCDLQTKRFNQEATALGDDVKVLTISADLPFAQARWCGAAGVKSVETLSDHFSMSFGTAYGVAIKELRLLTRAVFVLDKNARIAHMQIVPEVTEPVDFDAALAAVASLKAKG